MILKAEVMKPHERLSEIQEQMLELFGEAQDLVRRHANKFTHERAKAYWIGHIEEALGEETTCYCTMGETIKALDVSEDE
jgi:hypothetical protein